MEWLHFGWFLLMYDLQKNEGIALTYYSWLWFFKQQGKTMTKLCARWWGGGIQLKYGFNGTWQQC
jgi:hypothetical protein